MSDKPRFVFDTNVVVGVALLKHSIPRKAFDKARNDGDILVSTETLAELNEVLMRSGFEKYVSAAERFELLASLLRVSRLIEVNERIRVCRHPSDDKFLELAVAGKATCIVSGDNDLILLHPFRDIAIVSPRDFMDEVWRLG